MRKPSPNISSRRGSALLLVLACLLLLTTLVVAFLTRATLERQLSSASSNFGKTDLAAQGAIAMIISDLQQEIVAGSYSSTFTDSANPNLPSGNYYPKSPLTVIPQIVGFTQAAGVEDLLKISKNGQPFYSGSNYNTTTYPAPNRAANVNTTNNPSLNSRSVSTARWNKPLLMAKATPTSTTDFTPVTAFTANPPDWIYVARDGSNPTSWDSSYIYRQNVSPTSTPTLGTIGSNAVTQRYAYAIYDEGSTLDMNVAGNPSYTPTSAITYSYLQPYKSALAYADLTQLPYFSTTAQTVATGSSTTLTAPKQVALINAIVGWRNFSSAQVGTSSYFPSSYTYTTPSPAPPAAPWPFDQSFLFNTSGLMSLPATTLASTPNTQGNANQSDNVFASRQQLMQFLLQGMGQNPTFSTAIAPSSGTALAMLQNLLPYLGTFSRDISQPSYAPPSGRPVVLSTANGGNSAVGADSTVNPNLLGVTITTAPASTVTRNNGAPFVAGEPLLKKRFALNRLAWVTYAGPSALRTQTDADIVALNSAGIPASFLALGTAANIKNFLGLNWDSTNHRWQYNAHNGTSGTGTTGPILTLAKIAALSAPHEPDFFEILKATMGVGSLAKALANSNTQVGADTGGLVGEQPANYNYYAESSVDFQILQIGANIIDQFQPANWPIQIVFDDGSGAAADPRTIVGVENLPYLYTVMNGGLQVQAPVPLPRTGYNGTGSYSGSTGSGIPGNSGYQSGDVITTSGVGAWMQLPIIWNPHDPSSSTGASGPKNFRVVADSATPDQVASNGTYNSFFVYANSVGVGAGSNYSYAAAPASPSYSWFGDTSGTGATHAHMFKNPSNSTGNAEVDFTVSAVPTKVLCPEPMILMRPGTITDNNGNSITVSVPSSTALMKVDTAVSALVTGGGLPNYIPDAPQMQSPESLDVANKSYVGFYLGAFPLAWNTTSSWPCSEAQSGASLSRAGLSGTPPGSTASCYMTYRMQYQDPNNASSWITYDTKYGKPYLGGNIGMGVCPANGNNGNVSNAGVLVGAGDWAFMTDPRSSRFGLMANASSDQLVESGGQGYGLPGPELSFWSSADKYAAGWIDTVNGIMYTSRPDGQAGFYCKTGWSSAIGTSSGWMAWISSDTSAFQGIVPGLLSQNNTDIYYFPHHFYGDAQGAQTQTPNYFADPDGMVRRGMGAFVQLGITSSPEALSATDIPSADTTIGLPLARAFNWKTYTPSNPSPSITVYSGPTQTTSQAQSRPFFLHRPFYSVGELGYAFSDTPWRNLDFFTAESGNTAILDAFCINDTTDPGGLVAGKINLNTRQVPVLQAVLAGGCLDPVQVIAAGGANKSGQLDTTTANLVAKALVARTTDTTNLANGTGPLRNISELVGKWQKSIAINDLGGMITGVDKGTLSSATGFYDGKLSYAGFSGGVWDNSTTTYRKPYVNGVENFSSSTGAPASTGVAEDVYSAYYNSSSFATSANHNGTQETSNYIQRFREAPIRSLAAVGTTRVWNLMIDVIAQTGRFPSSAGNLASFNVEGERRYWVHVAIDRYTGRVLDEQVEEVKE